MNRSPLVQAVVVGVLTGALAAARAQPSFVSENDDEFYTTADFDGDGRDDLAIVDRRTGACRIGYQVAPGNYSWVSPRASGVDNVSSLAVGTLLVGNRSAVALTSPEVNRVNLLDLSNPAGAVVPTALMVEAIGPNLVTALDIGGAGNTPQDDLFIGSIYNGSLTQANRFTLVRVSSGAKFQTLGSGLLAGPLARGNSVLFRSNYPSLLGVITRRSPGDAFQAFELSSGALVLKTELAYLPAGSDYVFGNFGGKVLTQFLFYQPGQSNLWASQLSEPSAGTFNFLPLATFHFTSALRQVFVLPGNSSSRLMILFGIGETAIVYDFDGANGLTALSQFYANPGERLTGVVPTGNYGFMVFSSTGDSLNSTQFKHYAAERSGYVPGASGSLPAVSLLTARANVFEFAHEPFVTTQPVLVRSLNAGDWTSSLTFQGGAISVLKEVFLDSAQGLGQPTPMTLGLQHPLAGFGLANQYSAAISLFSFSSAVGNENSEVAILPKPGIYSTSIRLAFVTSDPNHQVYYRASLATAWSLYNSAQPFELITNATVYYYAQAPGQTAKSIIHTAHYAFTEDVATRDSNRDGVPDFVELANGLDPLSSIADADGDGFSNKEELLAGTKPRDATSHPSVSQRLEDKASFDLLCTPRPWDGFANIAGFCSLGPVLQVHDLQGGLLGFGTVTNFSTAWPTTNPSVMMLNLGYDRQLRLVTAGTEPHYEILTTNRDKAIGREMVRLVALPKFTPVSLPNTWSPGDLTTETARWTAAASNAYATATHELVQCDLTIDDTLSALLAESKIAQILKARGLVWATNISLFPYRTADLTRSNVSQTFLLSLESRTATQPGYLLRELFGAIDQAVRTSHDPAIVDLRTLTREIYRISSSSNNASPGFYFSPIDVLRTFLQSGTLESNYLAAANLPPATQRSAAEGVKTILGLVQGRPTAEVSLRVRPDIFAGPCTVLETVGTPAVQVGLFDALGKPFRLASGFGLLPGSELLVSAYTDLTAPECLGQAMEVISITLTRLPSADQVDADTDGQPDEWEFNYFGDLSYGPDEDLDGDGFTNWQEYVADTNPTQANSCLRILDLQLSAEGIEIRWQGGLAVTQYLQRSDNLATGAWTNLLTNLPPTEVLGSYYDTPSTNLMRWYRLKVVR